MEWIFVGLDSRLMDLNTNLVFNTTVQHFDWRNQLGRFSVLQYLERLGKQLWQIKSALAAAIQSKGLWVSKLEIL
jgi:hypothetical protein